VLDLKQAEHFAALEKLLQTADIFIYSVRPKAMARMGLTPERFAELNPGMISVSLVGYGEGGPYPGRPAYEDLIQGLTAIPSLLTRTGSAQPQYVPVSCNDRAVGVYAAAMMMIAWNHRNRTGEGQHIEDSAPGQAPCSAPRREHRRGPDRARLLRRGVPQDRRRFINNKRLRANT
jgi:crotonobetainyl-CoA:carnitine CoA-transferase CaiB-like acyl-CoA transferase